MCGSSGTRCARRRAAIGWRRAVLLVAGCGVLVAGLTGCESLQRKFKRKSSESSRRPTPIISFQDYTRMVSPLDRYRKHYMMFEYWNDQLIQAFQSPPINPKRYKQASAESLGELSTMRVLLADDVGSKLDPLIKERTTLDRRLQGGVALEVQASEIIRMVDAHMRRIHREFFWRDVEEQVKGEVRE